MVLSGFLHSEVIIFFTMKGSVLFHRCGHFNSDKNKTFQFITAVPHMQN